MKAKNKGMTEAEAKELRKNPVNDFTCCNETMKHKDFMVHLKDKHKIEPKGIKGKKSMLMHIDGDKWFSYSYQWELEGGLKFTQYTMQARSKMDLMYYER